MDAAERYRRAKQLLLEALDRPVSEREAFLDAACEDTELRREVDELLMQENTGPTFLDQGILSANTQDQLRETVDRLRSEDHVPERIGPYTIVGILGEGGMGTVYHGRQSEPVEREVAVKVLRAGLDGRRVLARFEWERKALARLDHPHIARVLDAGTDPESSRPYVALPLIDGHAITQFCDEHDLDLEDRLRLFLRVCRAVEHAHARGVLHRDIKPGNVLVHMVDGEAVPVVIDFGIAKALDPDTTGLDATMTMDGQRVGTPAYMSPEQLYGDTVRVDVRSDVYALGIILWELLAGSHPFGDSIDSVTRALQAGKEPPPLLPPSRVDPKTTSTTDRWRRRLRGDLDTICLRAVDFDRARRYASAAHLAEDVQRFLDGRTVLARPDTWSYRLGKSVRRHPVVTTAFAGATAVLVTGAILLALNAQRLQVERDRALDAEARARIEAEQAQAISNFLTGLFTEVDPVSGDAADLSARELLAQGAVRARAQLDDQPELRGPLLHSIGYVQHQIGLYAEAESLLVDAIADLEKLGTSRGDSLAMEAYRSLGITLHDQGRYAEGEAAARTALAMLQELYGRTHPEYAVLLSDMAVDVQAQGRLEEAIEILQEALALQEAMDPRPISEIAWTRGTIGYVYSKLGRMDDAATWLQSAHDEFVTQSEDEQNRFELVYHLNNLGGVNMHVGRIEEAKPYLNRALEVSRAMHGEDHAVVGRAYFMLGRAHLRSGEVDVAAPLIERGVGIVRETVGADHIHYGRALGSLVDLRRVQGRFDSALERARQALDVRRAVVGEDHDHTANAHSMIAELLLETEDPTGALEQIDAALRIFRANHGPDHQEILELRVLRAWALADLGRDEDVRSELEGLADLVSASPGVDDRWGRRARDLEKRFLAERR